MRTVTSNHRYHKSPVVGCDKCRFDLVMEASADEGRRFNEAITNGAIVMLDTFSGSYRVKYVDRDFWYHTDGNGGFGMSWAGSNDGTWAVLMQRAGVKRNKLWEGR